jgi:benzil reductase ((S)-benzoin forming)
VLKTRLASRFERVFLWAIIYFMTHLYIVTGSSRGLGQAIAEQLATGNHQVVGIARQQSERLSAIKAQHPIEQWTADLADASSVAERLETFLRDALANPKQAVASISLINNAAFLANPVRLGSHSTQEIIRAVDVGLTAPLLLCNAFLRATQTANLPKSIVNISSGLGRRAMSGSSTYCATKAGMDHLSRTIDLEQQETRYPARVCSLAPGVIDTDMQVQLRGAPDDKFTSRQNFQDLKDKGLLDSPQVAAVKVIAYMARPSFGKQVIADVRDSE